MLTRCGVGVERRVVKGGGSSDGVGRRRVCAFLFLSRPIFALFVFLWGLLVEFLVVFEAPEP